MKTCITVLCISLFGIFYSPVAGAQEHTKEMPLYPLKDQLRTKLGDLTDDFWAALLVWNSDSLKHCSGKKIPLGKKEIEYFQLDFANGNYFELKLWKSAGYTAYLSFREDTPPWRGFLDEKIELRRFAKAFIELMTVPATAGSTKNQ